MEDPLGRLIEAKYGLIGGGRTAIIEMAQASGLALLKQTEKNALLTSTMGFGQLIRHALDRGVRHMILCIGGSATNDG